ncbi:hypothetical protein [Actinomadura sp. B10D3]|uniref:hypothetical protein n=1 Tax=Actinomadura sp. B10D3 TaxID=3153557 RepID=UPI00325C7EF6
MRVGEGRREGSGDAVGRDLGEVATAARRTFGSGSARYGVIAATAGPVSASRWSSSSRGDRPIATAAEIISAEITQIHATVGAQPPRLRRRRRGGVSPGHRR